MLAAGSPMAVGTTDAAAVIIDAAAVEGTAGVSRPVEAKVLAIGGEQGMSALRIKGNWCCPPSSDG